eukprot:TRINITY_DN16586_c0_g1_i1.p1 TRINITY_DN16586_c0_g1~~TRINITY_DN16586_c0_g1_i1.p1  ORF type:complete len:391 (+),score=127.52 TRINITY_DN16586_c0_g1_i1:73-1173(+)
MAKRKQPGADAGEPPALDMRSDTVTLPTPAMRKAMHDALCGDDVFGEDPTVTQLEQECAKLFGKEAALFCTSGTQANLCAVMVHCELRGSEVILGDKSHICLWEQGGIACVAGAHPRTLPNRPDGTLDLAAVRTHVREDNVHYPRTRLVCIENTQNYCGGVALPPQYIDEAGAVCKELGLKLHLDGARIANACVHYGVSAERMCRGVDSTTLCLSKGLGAPAGSLLIGTKRLVAEARRARKLLGGGLRQVGVLAAPGRIAMLEMWDRLADDHRRAQRIADRLRQEVGKVVSILYGEHSTNMVFIETGTLSAQRIAEGAARRGFLVQVPKADRIRAVVNHHLEDDAAADRAAQALVEAVREHAAEGG